MSTVERLRNRLRTWMNVREPRSTPPSGPKPSVGARIISGRQRMSVQPGLSDALWDWLTMMGWREATFRPERRRYDDIPRAWVSRLYEATPEDRQRILRAAVAAAKGRNPTPPALF